MEENGFASLEMLKQLPSPIHWPRKSLFAASNYSNLILISPWIFENADRDGVSTIYHWMLCGYSRGKIKHR
ncbi:hypothetical protein NMG60_11013921 [Bertholletia excelsa]